MWAMGRFAVYLTKRYEAGRTGIVEPVVMTIRQPGDESISFPPAMLLEQEEAQRFIDELWNAGLRPTEGTGSAGSLAATQRHLDDMRALVFKGKIEPQKTRT